MITVLSVHNTGTRFLLHMIGMVMGLDVTYVHFSPRFLPALKKLDGIVVMPVRKGRPVPDEYLQFIPEDVIRVDIAKGPQRWDQIDSLVIQADAHWTNDLKAYVEAWKPVGASKGGPDALSQAVIDKYVPDTLVAYPQVTTSV